ncbi:MAG: hypothetical protein NT105_18800 [Verrucomicrobia bacterium]|nr:hypothetical protein [Verrucomicrobiota bacterium]
MNRHLVFLLSVWMLAGISEAAEEAEEHIDKIIPKQHVVRGIGLTLKGNQAITTQATFKPPVEITIIAKTDSTDIRLSYAVRTVVFNWVNNPGELRVGGKPVGQIGKAGAGHVPINKYVTFKWIVLPTEQRIFVNDELRFEHKGDYSKINEPIGVSSYHSKVSVKSIKVRQLSGTRP